MAEGRIITVRVDDVLENDGNPRKAGGDIDALAESIRATGGQPVQPIIVVPDGDRWRLVDGWRRWLAMGAIGTEECQAVCFDSMGDAEEAVCAMATDSKLRLSDSERARGFQTMLALGVSDERVAAVTGVGDVAAVRRARVAAREAPGQATMDGIMAAADEEFSQDERLEIMGAAYPDHIADMIRRTHRHKRQLSEIRAQLPDRVDYRDGARPFQPERKDLSYIATVRSAKAAGAFADEHGDGDLVAYEDGTGYALYELLPEGEAAAMAEAKESARRRRVDGHRDDYVASWIEMRKYVLERLATPRGLPHFRDLVVSRRSGLSTVGIDMDELAELMDPFESEPSRWEIGQTLESVITCNGILNLNGDVNKYITYKYREPYDALVADGWEPSDSARAIREMCGDGDGDE